VGNFPVRLAGTTPTLPRVSDFRESPKQWGTLTLHHQRVPGPVFEVTLWGIFPFALQARLPCLEYQIAEPPKQWDTLTLHCLRVPGPVFEVTLWATFPFAITARLPCPKYQIAANRGNKGAHSLFIIRGLSDLFL
jgi:hypothetical protein